jgi:hypothetical protein
MSKVQEEFERYRLYSRQDGIQDKEVVNELMLLSGALDKDMNLTNDEGMKTSFKDALLTLKNSEEINTHRATLL